MNTRLETIDFLRGFVIILMALDHTRDYFTISHFDPTDLSKTYPLLFFTRWITHLCAPTFILLAGMSAFFLGQTLSKPQLSLFLIKRGIWLIFLEIIVVSFGWTFNFNYPDSIILQVIWAIGISMLTLSIFIYLPRYLLLVVSLAIIGLHNLFDYIDLNQYMVNGSLTWQGWLISFLHIQYKTVYYPVIPWIAVMSLGYVIAPIFLLEQTIKRNILFYSSVVLILSFVILRYTQGYGDQLIWQTQQIPIFTLLSFLNVSKYPPSLHYLLITLGIAFFILFWFEGKTFKRLGQAVIIFGRVPLFFYIIHIYLIHVLAIITAMVLGYDIQSFFLMDTAFPQDYGFDLPVVYGVWLFIVISLYPACVWFADIKQRYGKTHGWLRYL